MVKVVFYFNLPFYDTGEMKDGKVVLKPLLHSRPIAYARPKDIVRIYRDPKRKVKSHG